MTTKNTLTARSSVPKVERAPAAKSATEKSGHSLFMLACCVGMAAAFGFLVFTAPAGQGWGTTIYASLPLLGCVGAHLLMYKFMGRSCHGSKSERTDATDRER